MPFLKSAMKKKCITVINKGTKLQHVDGFHHFKVITMSNRANLFALNIRVCRSSLINVHVFYGTEATFTLLHRPHNSSYKLALVRRECMHI